MYFHGVKQEVSVFSSTYSLCFICDSFVIYSNFLILVHSVWKCMLRMIHAAYVQGLILHQPIIHHSPLSFLFSIILYFPLLILCLPSALLSTLVSCTFLSFSFLFTLPCSASMLPWQRSYRKSLLPRPRERSSFHRRQSDGEIWREREIRGIQL